MLNGTNETNDILINLPFFDFRKAEEEYGIYELVSENGFQDFINEKYLIELTELRQLFIKKDYEETRKRAHKIKSAFR
jgi:hypothetical protein